MHDIVHPYIGLGGVPVSRGGRREDSRDTAEMDCIRAEVMRLGAVAGPAPDWRVIVECAVVVLRDQRKDLRVACYLAWGLFEREGYLGLAVGLTIVKDMQALYWADLQPPLDRMKARLACLDWLAENLSGRVGRIAPNEGDRSAMKRILSVLVDLEEDLRAHFGHQAPPFGHLRRQVAEYLGQLPGPVPGRSPGQDDPSATPSAPPAFEDQVSHREETSGAMVLVPRTSGPRDEGEPAAPPAPPSPAPSPRRILTPLERSGRRSRIVAVLSLVLLVLGLGGGGAVYWVLEIDRVARVAALLRASDGETRAEGLARLASLPERQRAGLLREHADAILDYYLGLQRTEVDRYAFAQAEAYLAVARRLYPDSLRLDEATRYLERARVALPADVKRRLLESQSALTARIDTALTPPRAGEARQMLKQLEDRLVSGDLRNARMELDRLLALLPADDPTLASLVPQWTALLTLDLAEQRADRQYFTQSLQVISDGLTFLPDNPILQNARDRYLVGRDEYLLRNTVSDPGTLDSLLVLEAAAHLRMSAPDRFLTVIEELETVLEDDLGRLALSSPGRAAELQRAFQAIRSPGAPNP